MTYYKSISRALQVPLADRNLSQVDQAEPENQVIYRHLTERRHDPNLGRDDLLPPALLHQVPDKVPSFAP